jgi:hypothetical protein
MQKTEKMRLRCALNLKSVNKFSSTELQLQLCCCGAVVFSTKPNAKSEPDRFAGLLIYNRIKLMSILQRSLVALTFATCKTRTNDRSTFLFTLSKPRGAVYEVCGRYF